MLLSYKANNFGSFKEEFEFSMKPGRVIDRFMDNVIDLEGGKKVSKVAVIVGENAGGKTSFMRSLDFFKYIISQDGNARSLKALCYNYNIKQPQWFEIVTLIEKKIYTYRITLDRISILKEELYIRGINEKEVDNKTIYILERISVDDVDNDKSIQQKLALNGKYIESDVANILEKISGDSEHNWGIIINTLGKLGAEIVKPFIDWINNKLIIKLPSDHSLNVYKRLERNEKDLRILRTEEFLEIFSMIDSSIVDIKVDEKEPFVDSIIVREKGDGSKFKIKLKNDSSGVNDFFAWSIELWKVIYEDATLFADELDKVLNSILASRVLNFVKATEHRGQFIFSTHNVLHINTIDFMKEQIYFVNKDIDTLSSNLYPLSSFKEYRYEKSKVYELYLKGLLGGVPND